MIPPNVLLALHKHAHNPPGSWTVYRIVSNRWVPAFQIKRARHAAAFQQKIDTDRRYRFYRIEKDQEPER